MASPAPVPSPVEIGQLYFALHHRIHRLVDEAMSDAGLSLSRTKVLGILAEHGPIKQAAVATLLGFAPRSVTDTLDALEREGLATRGPDPTDRRAWLVEITPSGTVALQRALIVKKAAMNTIFGGLADTECQQFAAVLAGVAAYERAVVVKRGVMTTIFGGLDDTEREHLAALLVDVRTRLDSHLEAAHVS